MLKDEVRDLIIGGFDGTSVPKNFEETLDRGNVGGAILFARNIESVEQTKTLVEALRQIRPDLWLAIDQEGGRVQRLRTPFPELPPMRQIATPANAKRAAQILAEGLKALGFNQNYAPVVDVDTNPNNPIIGDRSFSDDAQGVVRCATAFIDGQQDGGVAACAKHFPGHGDTSEDSHLALPRLDHGLERLEKVELVPFRAAVDAGVATIMTAHVIFGPLDKDLPATLSPTLIEPILRRRWGYEGVVVSDDLEMKAIADNFGIEEAAVLAIKAGCDQLLVCHSVDLQNAVFEALVSATENGRLPRSRIEQASERVRAMKRRFPHAARPDIDASMLERLSQDAQTLTNSALA